MSTRDTKPDATPQDEGELKLSLEDTAAEKLRGVPVKTRSGVAGYNPYDAAPAKTKTKVADGKRNATDLRQLSQWIRLRREIAELNAEEPKKD